MVRALIVSLCLLGTSALAQQAPRADDVLLSTDDLTALLSGYELEFYDGSLGAYYSNGRYEYRYAPGEAPFTATYEITADSTVCSSFDNGFDRCDLVVRSGERYVMIVINGDRYPIKAFAEIE
ncbi:MAG: hypothetical protein AAGP08_07500 [Pseudomonadota bacterium]